MEINRKREFLIKHRIIGIDTSIFIYFIEQHPSYFQYCNRVFKLIEENRLQAVTPTLTLLEILVQPYRLKDENLVLSFYSLFTTYPHLRWVELTLDISDLAARLRAEHGLKTPDAIQIASALSAGATGFICNDKAFRKVKDIDCLILSE